MKYIKRLFSRGRKEAPRERHPRSSSEEPPQPQKSLFSRFRFKWLPLRRRRSPPIAGGQSSVLVDGEGLTQVLEEDERRMIRSIIKMDQTVVREIMVPRIDVAALEVTSTLSDTIRTIIDYGYSRIPIYEGTIDNIVGVLYAKDLLKLWGKEDEAVDMREVVRKPHFIPETKRIDELLHEFREKRVHMAIVVDEYGGVAGLVSLEDLLEEIVGEIEDEYDIGEPQIEHISPEEFVVDARMSIDAINTAFNLDLQGEDYDSLGGFIYHRLGKIPLPGDEVRSDGFMLSILSTSGRRIRKVKIRKVLPVDGSQGDAEGPTAEASTEESSRGE